MLSLVKAPGSTETKVNWYANLFLLEEFIAEVDAIINGPAAFGNPILQVPESDWEMVIDTMLKPPEPSEGLIALVKEYKHLILI
ncbi:hypothetical protein [Aerosakkonema funiforme]|uniref:hypothetical protein n=1 Tax=Aerosakkonema funiforme TaxID=1246630 RepID=UPI0035B9859E